MLSSRVGTAAPEPEEPRRLEIGGSRGKRGAQKELAAQSRESERGAEPAAPGERKPGALRVARSASGASRLDDAPPRRLAPSARAPGTLSPPETRPPSPRLPAAEAPDRAADPDESGARPHAPTMRLNSSAPSPGGAPGPDPFPLPPSGMETTLLASGLGNGSGNASERVRAAPNSDLDVNTDIYSKVLVTAVYLALFVVGTVGNSVTAFTLARKKSLQSLQSTVHYHLGSLALSDLLILLLAMPVELYNFIWVHHPWAFGDAVCRGYYFLRDACTYATALNVASLSVERYLAICHPFKAKTLMSRSRTKKFISAIWLASGLLAVPMLFTMGQQNRSADGQHPGGLVCTPIVGTATIKVVIQVSGLFKGRRAREK